MVWNTGEVATPWTTRHRVAGFGHDDTAERFFKQADLSLDEVSGGYGVPDRDDPRIDPATYTFRDRSRGDRAVAARYRDALAGTHHSLAVGGRPGRAFYGARTENHDGYVAVVEREAGDRLASVGIRDDLSLDAQQREDLRTAAITAAEDSGIVRELDTGAFADMVLEDGAP